MTTSFPNCTTITDLLNVLIKDHSELQWNLRCCFSDGEANTIMEIAFYEGPYRRVKGKVTFYANTGITINLRYRGYHPKDPHHIVDTLLDLVNFEKYQLASA